MIAIDERYNKEVAQSPWVNSPPRLWTLVDLMISFHCFELFASLHVLRSRLVAFGDKGERRAEPLLVQQRDILRGDLKTLEERCIESGLPDLALVVFRVRDRFDSPYDGPYSREVVHVLLDTLYNDLFRGLESHAFAAVPHDRTGYFEQVALFGERVRVAFPTAEGDIKGAGNCFALGAFTAAVFHLMRAVEIGLRVLAKELRVTFPDPIDYQEWHTIIEKIQSEATTRCDRLQGREAKTAARSFYNGAVGEFRAFKDAWRNHVMHARDSYDEPQALSVMNHVGEFMQRLSAKLSERKRTPIRWP